MIFNKNIADKILCSIFAIHVFFGLIFPLQCQAKLIQAEIEHKEVLPQVPDTFRLGEVVNLSKVQSRVEWFPVPQWMAGKWTKEGDIETFEKNFLTGRTTNRQVWLENKVSLSFGHQVDALNTIWHAEALPIRADGKRGAEKDQRYVVAINCLKSTTESVVLRFHTIVVSLDDRGRVSRNRQQEEIVEFFPQDNRDIATTSSTKTFSSNGQPLYRLDSHTKRLKTGNFKPVSHLSGIDLKQSLKDFLSSRNMVDRIAGN